MQNESQGYIDYWKLKVNNHLVKNYITEKTV